jgi:DNA-binding transcriptional ArsR family regulator
MSIQLMSDVLRNVHGMPSGRRMLLLALANFANGEGLCWPSIKSLALDADLGERHVSAELKELAKAGYITIEEHAGKSNHYRLHIAQGVNHSSGVSQGASRTTVQGGDEPQFTTTPEPQFTQTVNRTMKEPPRDRSRPREMYSAEYETFWAHYPKGRGSKKDTYALWTKLNPDAALFEEIMHGLDGWHRSERWAVKQMVMEAERWIRGRYWENPPPEAVRHPSQLGIPA